MGLRSGRRVGRGRGGWVGFEFARVGLILTRGEYRFWLIYEAYELKKRGGKFMMSFLLRISFFKMFSYEAFVMQKN